MGLLIIYLVSTLMVGCMSSDGYSTKIKLEGGETPIFTVSGSGLLGNFKIYGPRQRSGEDGRAFTVWEIQPVKGHLEGESLEKIGSIKYGIVPNGYKQIYPEDGSMPPPIVPGVRYIYWAQTVNAPEAREAFELIGGKATVVPGNK